MIVEDARDIREIIARLYESEGYEVIGASDGSEALEKLREQSVLPTFILLDLMMPGMDGYQFRAEQEKDPRLASVPVIVMTADANAREKSIKIGAKGYIKKPAEISTLLAVASKYGQEPA